MASARTKAGMSAADLERLRTAVGAGRRPKVMFTAAAGQIAGKTGQVTRLEDPNSSDEWVVVRFGKDELPFAPTDLQFPPKPAPAKVAAQRVETIEPPHWTPAAPPATEKPATEKPATEPAAEPSAPKPAAVPAARPAARRSVVKRSPELTITLSCEEGHWSVQAHKGAKALVKATPVRASEALKMVSLLDAPPVQAVVEDIVEAARVDAEQQAERLRRELAEVEAALADLRQL
jgi:hypothetical protein